MKKTLLTAIAAVAIIAAAYAQAPKSHDAAVSRGLTTFTSLVKQMELNYVDSIDVEQSFKAAINAFLANTDPYTEYFDSDEQEAIHKMTTGDLGYGGIGSYLLQRDSSTYISAPMEGAPAARGGLKAGDRLLRVDTMDVSQIGVEGVTKVLRGEPGTTVSVTVQRPFATDSILTFSIEREKLAQPSVPYAAVLPDGTGYIQLTSFIDKSPDEVEAALRKFKEDPRFRSVVLDLRGNGGGLLESAVDIVGFFVPKGTEVLHTKGRDNRSERTYKTTRTPLLPDIPLAVLIDGGSASASEITAGSLQDLDRAVLVGSRSFGKGLVQSTLQMPYDALLKVTTAKYYIPSGRLIQAIDYSHRNPDGSVARVPDSLTNIYKTLHGREVRDGGGLTPDVEVEWEKLDRLVFNIVRDNWAFDYATRYAAENQSIPPAEEFEITDEIFADFKKSIDPERFKYDKVCEEMMKDLREAADREGYLNDETREQLDVLAKLLTHNLDHDLDQKRQAISTYLGEEIASRYYYDRGKIIQSLRNDPGLDKAREILNSPGEMQRLLTGKGKK